MATENCGNRKLHTFAWPGGGDAAGLDDVVLAPELSDTHVEAGGLPVPIEII